MTRMVSCLEDRGNFSLKSMEMEFPEDGGNFSMKSMGQGVA